MNATTKKAPAVICPYCNKPAQFLQSSAEIYHGRDYGPVYACLKCQAWVGVHDGTREPKGRLADKALRQAKMAVHAVFDHLWQDLTPAYPDLIRAPAKVRSIARDRAYLWLAKQLGISSDECHVGMFDLDRCREAVNTINFIKPNSATIREWFKAQQTAAHGITNT